MTFDVLTIIYGLIVGLSLGLTGGGGSILAIPLLVYGLGIPMSQAMVISLLMVASVSLFGAGRQSFEGNVDWRAAILFSITGMIVSPFVIYVADGINETLRMISFAILMLFVAYKMAFSNRKNAASNNVDYTQNPVSKIKIAIGGAVAGTLSGFFGVGGGFIIVPLLSMIFAIPYRKAVGTSLAAIFLISISAVAGGLLKDITIEWGLFSLFVGGGIMGMLIGSAFVNTIPESKAKLIFSAIAATMAAYMIINKILIH